MGVVVPSPSDKGKQSHTQPPNQTTTFSKESRNAVWMLRLVAYTKKLQHKHSDHRQTNPNFTQLRALCFFLWSAPLSVYTHHCVVGFCASLACHCLHPVSSTNLSQPCVQNHISSAPALSAEARTQPVLHKSLCVRCCPIKTATKLG